MFLSDILSLLPSTLSTYYALHYSNSKLLIHDVVDIKVHFDKLCLHLEDVLVADVTMCYLLGVFRGKRNKSRLVDAFRKQEVGNLNA